MQIYRVGGAVRDQLLGLSVKETDWVVVGATVEDMLSLGFTPVGKDFPVFLHPLTHEEYALARTERKSGRGYKGFTVYANPDVTLKEDLIRRDLTINAMAENEQGELFDPFGGKKDLHAGILRHVSPAFIEDPVRILRLARFAARFNFEIASETRLLCREMVAGGEVDHLVPERVWQEISRALMEPYAYRAFEVLRECHALACIAPELEVLFAQFLPEIGEMGPLILRSLQTAVSLNFPLSARYALLCHRLNLSSINKLRMRWRVPTVCHDLSVLACRERALIDDSLTLDAKSILDLLKRTDAIRRPERFGLLLDVCYVDWCSINAGHKTYPQASTLKKLGEAVAYIDTSRLASQYIHKNEIAQAIYHARVEAIAQTQKSL